MINVTGNHDIGYGYDISQERIERWEHIFGKSNFITSMDIPTPTNSEGANFNNETDSREEQNVARNNRRLHLVVLNTMLLDGPSTDENLRGQTWEFLQEASTLKERNPQDKIVLLTHIPLHKEQGICVDPPDIRVHWDNTIIEQTMLTPNTTQWILNHLQPDFILNGHDHFGCDVTHTLHFGQTAWTASLTSDPSSSTLSPTPWPTHDHGKQQENYNRHHHHQTVARKVREVTQRSMMAEFSGYSGLFEIKAPSMSTPSSSKQTQELLEFHYTACGFFNDLQVWIIIVTDLVVIILWSLYGLLHLISASLLSVIPSLGQKKNKPILSTGKQKIL
ncbi:hypothetical protein FBU30_004538 [Linnemannia zychae]|nr:hypothetical protein FBU30_004538 [Linnemannia zychae]